MSQNTQITIPELPEGKLLTTHFKARETDISEPNQGEILVQNVLLSIDAANRAWMQGATYREAINPGDVMHGYGIGKVVNGNNTQFNAGDLILGEIGWQSFSILKADSAVMCVDHKPLSNLLSVLGIAGKTAYHGLINVAGIKEGETLVVSGAAGSVGSLVGQIGKIKGANVVGVAGGKDKCQWVVEELGFDDCVDYKAGSISKSLRGRCPKGIDVYFDNTGGEILQAALFSMRNKGRIACCGAVSLYDGKPLAGPVGIPGLIVVKRLRMEGFIVFDFPEKDEEALDNLSNWASSGKLKVVEDIIDGIENAPEALVGLLAGENRGKRMVRISQE